MTTPAAPDDKKPNISVDQVKRLHERTGAPMMDCKKALQAKQRLDEARVWLRKHGMFAAAKKAARITSEAYVQKPFCGM